MPSKLPVDNKRLTFLLTEYSEQYRKAKKNNEPLPSINDEIGEMVMIAATRYATTPQFNRYSYRDDLVAYAIMCVVSYVHNFDSTKSNNGFAYVTQIIKNAFIRYIKAEYERTHRKMYYAEHQDGYYSTLYEDDESYMNWKRQVVEKNKGILERRKQRSADRLAKLNNITSSINNNTDEYTQNNCKCSSASA